MSDHNEAGGAAGAQREGTGDHSHDAQVDHNGEDGTGHGQGDDGGSNAGSQGQSRSSRRAGGSAGVSATHSGDGDGDDGGSAGDTPGKRGRDGAPTSTAGAGTKDEEEERLRKRRRQNRESAAVCRERRKKELADARAEAQALRSANDQLRKLIVEQRLRMAEAEQMAASLSHGMPNFVPAGPTQAGLGDGGAAPGTILSAASTAERSALNNIWMQQLRASLWQAQQQQQQPASAQAPAHSGPSAAAVAGSGAGAGAGAGAGTGMPALYQRALQAAGFQRGMASRSPAVSAAMNAIAGGANQRPHGTGAQASPTGIHAPSAQALYQQQRAPGAANPPLNGQPPGSIAQTLQLMAGGRVPMALARADNRGYLLLPMNAMSGRVDPTAGVNAHALRGLLGSALGAGAPAGTPSSGLGKRMQ